MPSTISIPEKENMRLFSRSPSLVRQFSVINFIIICPELLLDDYFLFVFVICANIFSSIGRCNGQCKKSVEIRSPLLRGAQSKIGHIKSQSSNIFFWGKGEKHICQKIKEQMILASYLLAISRDWRYVKADSAHRGFFHARSSDNRS